MTQAGRYQTVSHIAACSELLDIDTAAVVVADDPAEGGNWPDSVLDVDVDLAVGSLDSIAVAGHDGPGMEGAEAVAVRIVVLVALVPVIFSALGTVQTSQLVAEPGAPPVVELAAALVPGLLSASVPGPGSPPAAEHLAVPVLELGVLLVLAHVAPPFLEPVAVPAPEPGAPPAPELVAEPDT
jgi:hypothetical protein